MLGALALAAAAEALAFLRASAATEREGFCSGPRRVKTSRRELPGELRGAPPFAQQRSDSVQAPL